MRSTSLVSTSAHWIRVNSPSFEMSMSPRPISWSAPGRSMIVRESIICITRKAIRAGKLALILPVMTSTDGRCVAMIR